jgi:hypothetical protein
MGTDILKALHERIEEDLDGLALTPDGLRAVTDARWGELTLHIDHDPEAATVRVSAAIPPPVGAGVEFLIWCLSLNGQYFDVKVALDEDGRLLVHSDLDADDMEPSDLATDVVDAAESVLDLIDDDLVEWCVAHGLGTPAQRQRWTSRGGDIPSE